MYNVSKWFYTARCRAYREEVTCLHALLAAYLNGVELQPLVGTSHEQALALYLEQPTATSAAIALPVFVV